MLFAAIITAVVIAAETPTPQSNSVAITATVAASQPNPCVHRVLCGGLRLFISRIGNRRAVSLRREDVVSWLSDLETDNVGGRLREVAYRLLKAACAPYVTHAPLREHPFPTGKGPRANAPEIRAWNREEAQQFLAAAAEDRYHAVYVLALVGGLRQGEILALRWRDLRDDLVTVRGTLNRKTRTVVEPKTEAGRRIVAIPPFAVAALAEHRERQKAKRHSVGPDEFVFTAKSGTPVGVKNLYHHSFVPLMERASVPRISFHALRHTNASLALAGGVNMRVLQEQLGHRDVGVLLRRYAHLIPCAQREAAAVVGDLLAPALYGDVVRESGGGDGVLDPARGSKGRAKQAPSPPSKSRKRVAR